MALNNVNEGNSELLEKTMTWLQKKINSKEEITMPVFCKDFKFTVEEDADSAFLSLLSTNLIPQTIRAAVLRKYEIWKRNEGKKFWGSTLADYTIDVSTDTTVKDLVERGQYFTTRRLQQRPQDESRGMYFVCYRHHY